MGKGKVNKKKQENLKLTRVVELLEYHRDFGKFYWIKKSSKYSNIKVGEIAGTLDNKGYITIQIDGIQFKAHRLAWFVEHSEWPSNYIDHRNGDKTDNRLENLRDVSTRTNGENRAKNKRLDPMLPTGVHVNPNRRGEVIGYKASWKDINGKNCQKYFSLYLYGTPEAAIAAALTYREVRIAERIIEGAAYTARHGLYSGV
jgi:hypothetical protein